MGGGDRLRLLDGGRFRSEGSLVDLGWEVEEWKDGDLVVDVFVILERGGRQ